MPAAADLQYFVAPGLAMRDKNPREVLYEMVFFKLKRNHCVSQSFLDSMIELYCQWNEALGRKACAKDAEQIINLAVKNFMEAVPLKNRKTPML